MGLYEENKDVYGLIIDNIKKYRKKKGLTQQGLSLRAHISKGYLSQIEAKNYNRFCSLDVLINIAQALEVPLYKLFLPPNVIFIDEAVSAELDLDKIQKTLAAMEEQDIKGMRFAPPFVLYHRKLPAGKPPDFFDGFPTVLPRQRE